MLVTESRDQHADGAGDRFCRSLLTRDTGLLKRREVRRGSFVRATAPLAQLTEIVFRFGLLAAAAPFTRCLRCNTLLQHADKAEVLARLPPRVREAQEEFARCPECDRIYWKGTHFARMTEKIRSLSHRLSG